MTYNLGESSLLSVLKLVWGRYISFRRVNAYTMTVILSYVQDAIILPLHYHIDIDAFSASIS